MTNMIKKAVEKELFDSQKYINQANQVQQNAKAEIIRLLREYVEGGQIDPSNKEFTDDYWLFCWENWDGEYIQMYAYGLNDKNELCFKAWYVNKYDDDFQNGEWCEFEEYGIRDQYHKVYEIVVDHILGNFNHPEE